MMSQKLTLCFLVCLVSTVLSACGNKGDLFLVPDTVSEEEIKQLQDSLDAQSLTDEKLLDESNLSDSERKTDKRKNVTSTSQSAAE